MHEVPFKGAEDLLSTPLPYGHLPCTRGEAPSGMSEHGKRTAGQQSAGRQLLPSGRGAPGTGEGYEQTKSEYLSKYFSTPLPYGHLPCTRGEVPSGMFISELHEIEGSVEKRCG